MEIGQVGSAEAVDSLVVIPDHTDIIPDQQPDQLELGIVCVLEFVNKNVGVLLPVPAENRGFCLQQPDRFVDHIVIIEQVSGALVLLVSPVHLQEIGKLVKIFAFGIRYLSVLLSFQVFSQFVRSVSVRPGMR